MYIFNTSVHNDSSPIISTRKGLNIDAVVRINARIVKKIIK